MVEALRLGLALDANVTLVIRVIGIALQPDDASVLDVSEHTAFAMARLADGPDYFGHSPPYAHMFMPQAATIVWPVMALDSSQARNTAV
jgi:hypothetical protein